MILVNTWKTVVLERYAKFDGRAGRAEFWWFYLATILLFIAAWIVALILGAIADFLGVIAIIAVGRPLPRPHRAEHRRDDPASPRHQQDRLVHPHRTHSVCRRNHPARHPGDGRQRRRQRLRPAGTRNRRLSGRRPAVATTLIPGALAFAHDVCRGSRRVRRRQSCHGTPGVARGVRRRRDPRAAAATGARQGGGTRHPGGGGGGGAVDGGRRGARRRSVDAAAIQGLGSRRCVRFERAQPRARLTRIRRPTGVPDVRRDAVRRQRSRHPLLRLRCPQPGDGRLLRRRPASCSLSHPFRGASPSGRSTAPAGRSTKAVRR